MSRVVQLHPSGNELDRAWAEFDSAMIELHAMYETGTASDDARRAAAERVVAARDAFDRLYRRSVGRVV